MLGQETKGTHITANLMNTETMFFPRVMMPLSLQKYVLTTSKQTHPEIL